MTEVVLVLFGLVFGFGFIVACAPSAGEDLCWSYPEVCEAARETWLAVEEQETLSPACNERLSKLRVKFSPNIVKYCRQDVAACSWWDGNIWTTAGFDDGETPMIYIHSDEEKPLNLMLHETIHHLFECSGRGWGSTQCYGEQCAHHGEIWNLLPTLEGVKEEEE